MRCPAPALAGLLVLAITASHAEAPAGEEDLALEPVQDLLRDEPDDRHYTEPPHEPLTEEQVRQLGNLLRSAEGGASSEQYQLGKRYATGKGAPYDLAEARRWYERAANNGNMDAANSLAVLLANGGRGVPRDAKGARGWLRKAAAANHPKALYNLGQQHRTGELFERDDERALRHFKQAADLGLPEAQTNVGTMYMEGVGTPADPRQAIRYWEQAAEAGEPRALYFLGLALYKGTPATGRDEAKAVKYLSRAKNMDYAPARKFLEEKGL